MGKVSEIDWVALGEPDLPKWLVDLASGNDDKFDAAYKKLELRLFRQDAVNNPKYTEEFILSLRDDIPLFVIPFLIELLTHESVQQKQPILKLLYNLTALSYVSEHLMQLIEPESSPYLARIKAMRETLRKGTVIFESFIPSSDGELDTENYAKSLLTLLDYDSWIEHRRFTHWYDE